MRLDVFADMTNDALKIHLQALRLRDKLLKGPWMALFHADDNQRNHFDQVSLILSSYLNTMHSVVPLMQHEEILIALCIVDHINLELFNEAIKIVVNATQSVMLRQYRSYIDGDLVTLKDESMQAASSAPAPTIWAERTLVHLHLFLCNG
ncbi:hypothetical protein BgiMline_030379 [Biomphalaria glabrata]